jgi:DNA-binding XRE family transcriptional regulator
MNTEMKDPHLAHIIKLERKRRNLTQEHLAQLAELYVRTIQRAERDGSCSSESLMAIRKRCCHRCEALDGLVGQRVIGEHHTYSVPCFNAVMLG